MKPAKVGQNVIIEDNVTFSDGVIIGNNVIIYNGTHIGERVIIQDNVVINKRPTRAKNSALQRSEDLVSTVIGNDCILGTSSIIYAGVVLEDEVFVADLVSIREKVRVGAGTIVGRGVAIENECVIGKKCKLETNCYITAYSILGDYVFIAPCVVTTNDNYLARTRERFEHFKGITVKNGGRIGANSTILPGRIIEEDGTVGAGSVVTKDVRREELVLGSPARKIKDVPVNQLLRNQ
ncbi:DapH/DapD/GlmU-related protein [Cohnella cellulosilytica]|uniref:DapH/DapD/GlmU-related protein n=2 Tax=Cohnella cellulosilytica TaxID=986710 RepID=A0ABW2FAD8_9BACL